MARDPPKLLVCGHRTADPERAAAAAERARARAWLERLARLGDADAAHLRRFVKWACVAIPLQVVATIAALWWLPAWGGLCVRTGLVGGLGWLGAALVIPAVARLRRHERLRELRAWGARTPLGAWPFAVSGAPPGPGEALRLTVGFEDALPPAHVIEGMRRFATQPFHLDAALASRESVPEPLSEGSSAWDPRIRQVLLAIHAGYPIREVLVTREPGAATGALGSRSGG